jgi:oligoendopeptidase F
MRESDWSSDVCSSDLAFAAVQKDIAEFPKLSGTLGKSPESLLFALKRESEISLALERLYVYAHMRRDEDNAVPKYQGMTDRAMQQGVAFGAAASFFTPEVLEIDPATLRKWIDGDVLKKYRRVLNNVERARPHTLTRDEEKLLALAGEPLAAADSNSPCSTTRISASAKSKRPRASAWS